MAAPRIPELPETLDERQQAIFDKIKAGPRGRVRGPLALWLYSPDVAERAQHLGEMLRFKSAFEPRLSELIILCVAARHRCQFEWFVHAPIAERNGLPAAAIEAIRTGGAPVFEKDDERLLHAFVAALLARDKVEQGLFDAFRAKFGERGVIEATAIMGYYEIGAHLLNAVEYDAPEGEQPFRR
jgi:4-carboxymuconolactone decarboxylase